MLPVGVWKAMKLTGLEQSVARIPKERWQSSHPTVSELDKENVPPSGSKRPALESAASLPAKRSRTSTQHLQTARTLLV